ncbi:MAG: hypothetical protein AAFV54_09750 [Pseudomonadota bacterium]
MSDPMAEIDRIFAHFDRPLPADQRAAMQEYLKNRPRTKYGKHRYALEQFNLTETDLRPLFSDYLERFGELT